MVYEDTCVFLSPQDLVKASHIVRKKLTQKGHLDDIIVDKSYLAAFITFIPSNGDPLLTTNASVIDE